MAYITIETDNHGGVRTLHERLSCDDLDNALFCERLVERMQWAVEDTDPERTRMSSAPPGATLSGAILTALDPRQS
jgi:hypothetical protein